MRCVMCTHTANFMDPLHTIEIEIVLKKKKKREKVTLQLTTDRSQDKSKKTIKIDNYVDG